jgi:hypothetical protein
MSIIKRAKRNTPFVQIDKTPLQDKNLSLKAKGLLAYLLSLPDNWQIYVSELQNHSKDGRDSTTTALNELIENKYVLREKKREKGKFKGYEYTVSDTPFTEKPKTVKPKTENNELIITNNNNNKDFNNKTSKSVKETHTQDFLNSEIEKLKQQVLSLKKEKETQEKSSEKKERAFFSIK